MPAQVFTKWVGQAWDQVSANALIIRSFKKCGISVPIDNSHVDQIHVKGLNDYKVEDSNNDMYTDEEKDPFLTVLICNVHIRSYYMYMFRN